MGSVKLRLILLYYACLSLSLKCILFQCPYCHRTDFISDATEDTNFCLEKHSDGFRLKDDHVYYYQVRMHIYLVKSHNLHHVGVACMQVQCQLFCTRRSYCDFVVWTENDVHITRVFPDHEFWLANVTKVRTFFETSILAELTGKFYSRTSQPSNSEHSLQEPSSSGTSSTLVDDTDLDTDGADVMQVYCYCQGPEEGEMVGCDNPNCKYQWFHIRCLKLDSLPMCKYWYCPDCRKLPNFKRKGKGKK